MKCTGQPHTEVPSHLACGKHQSLTQVCIIIRFMTRSHGKTHTQSLLSNECQDYVKERKNCEARSAVLLYFRGSIKFLVPFKKMTQLVKKQAFCFS